MTFSFDTYCDEIFLFAFVKIAVFAERICLTDVLANKKDLCVFDAVLVNIVLYNSIDN